MRVLVFFGLIIVVFGFALLRTHIKLFKLSRLGWEDLLASLKPVPLDGIKLIATDYLAPTEGQITIQPDELWTLISGVDGLRRMNANINILMALASYAERWNFEEAVIVAERMRSDAATLRRAIRRLLLSLVLRKSGVLAPFRVQEAASAYYLMRQRLLALYATSHAGRYPTLLGCV